MSGLLSDSGTGFNLVCNLVYMSDWPVISPEKMEKFNKVSSKYDKKNTSDFTLLFCFCFPKNVYVKTISIQSCLQPRVHE